MSSVSAPPAPAPAPASGSSGLRSLLSSLPSPPKHPGDPSRSSTSPSLGGAPAAASTPFTTLSSSKLNYVMSRNKYSVTRLEEMLTSYAMSCHEGGEENAKEWHFQDPMASENIQQEEEEEGREDALLVEKCIALAAEFSKIQDQKDDNSNRLERGRRDLESMLQGMEADEQGKVGTLLCCAVLCCAFVAIFLLALFTWVTPTRCSMT